MSAEGILIVGRARTLWSHFFQCVLALAGRSVYCVFSFTLVLVLENGPSMSGHDRASNEESRHTEDGNGLSQEASSVLVLPVSSWSSKNRRSR